MKKPIIFLFLMHAPLCFSMNVSRAAGVVATPIFAPGAYYYAQTAYKQKQIEARASDKKQRGHDLKYALLHADTFKPFMDGVCAGTIPILNLLIGSELLDKRKQKSVYEMWDKRNRVFSTGFASGASLYATVPIVLKLLKKVPK